MSIEECYALLKSMGFEKHEATDKIQFVWNHITVEHNYSDYFQGWKHRLEIWRMDKKIKVHEFDYTWISMHLLSSMLIDCGYPDKNKKKSVNPTQLTQEFDVL